MRESKQPTGSRRLLQGKPRVDLGWRHAGGFIHRALVICLTAALLSCGNLSSSLVSDPVPLNAAYARDHDLAALVETLAKPLVMSGENVGVSVGVTYRDGRSFTFGYGKRGQLGGPPPDADTVFAVGSLTKSFTALLVYELSREGLLDIHDTAGDILRGRSIELSRAAQQITIEQLIDHTSGLPRQPNNLKMLGSMVNYLFTGENIYRHINERELLEYLREFDPDPSDVGKFRYSNIGFGLLGFLIEAKMGKPLTDLFDERIVVPLGMRDTAYTLNSEQGRRSAIGHVGDSPFFVRRNTPMEDWHMDKILRGAAGLHSTTNDLMKFARYQMGLRDTAIPREVAGATNIFHVGKPLQYLSFGWLVDEFEDEKIRITFQHGIIAGFSAYLGVEQERGIAVVVLYNNFNWNEPIGHNLLLTLARDSDGAFARSRPFASQPSTATQ